MRPIAITKCSEESDNREVIDQYQDLIEVAKKRMEMILMAQ